MASDFPSARFVNAVKSLLHNIGVVIVGFGVALLGAALDSIVGLTRFRSAIATTAAWLLIALGFLLRVWATFYFYEQQMKVISLCPRRSFLLLALIASQEIRYISVGTALSSWEQHYSLGRQVEFCLSQ